MSVSKFIEDCEFKFSVDCDAFQIKTVFKGKHYKGEFKVPAFNEVSEKSLNVLLENIDFDLCGLQHEEYIILTLPKTIFTKNIKIILEEKDMDYTLQQLKTGLEFLLQTVKHINKKEEEQKKEKYTKYNIGQLVLCKDRKKTAKSFKMEEQLSIVKGINNTENRVFVHYLGWHNIYDEWLPTNKIKTINYNNMNLMNNIIKALDVLFSKGKHHKFVDSRGYFKVQLCDVLFKSPECKKKGELSEEDEDDELL